MYYLIFQNAVFISRASYFQNFIESQILKSCEGIWKKYNYSFRQDAWILMHMSHAFVSVTAFEVQTLGCL